MKDSEVVGARVRLPPPLVFAAFLVAGLVLQYAVLPLHPPFPSLPRILFGALTALAGSTLLAVCARSFRRTGEDLAPWTPSPSLISRGPYRWSRNPIYVGMTLAATGIGLALDTPWVVLFAGVSLVVVHFTAVLPEERYLAETFGEAYDRYRTSVRRYF